MMLHMTLPCASCGEYLGRGTKFNARKEDAAGERYLGGIQVFWFYIRCPRCSAEIASKTDPRNSDYAVESGAAPRATTVPPRGRASGRPWRRWRPGRMPAGARWTRTRRWRRRARLAPVAPGSRSSPCTTAAGPPMAARCCESWSRKLTRTVDAEHRRCTIYLYFNTPALSNIEIRTRR
ncbi:uncharacterized protein LOC112892284 [Panicum hallii]|uniref:uncharacterized protein LOC112892284 n=1 Tax=Panicum hallii TaxID=206008 RepID=UPI000DF4EABE|nr:uncharacterized protein LOC112892284 [Panicum hallii]